MQTFNYNLVNTSDYMRLALSDTDVSGTVPGLPYFQDETYNQMVSSYGYPQALAQLAQAIINIADPVKWSAGSDDGSMDFTSFIEGLKQLISDCRAGLVNAPGAAPRLGVAAGQLSTGTTFWPQPDMRGFRP